MIDFKSSTHITFEDILTGREKNAMRNLFTKLVNSKNKKIISVLAGVVIISCLITTVCLGCGLSSKDMLKNIRLDNNIVKSVENTQESQCNRENKECLETTSEGTEDIVESNANSETTCNTQVVKQGGNGESDNKNKECTIDNAMNDINSNCADNKCTSDVNDSIKNNSCTNNSNNTNDISTNGKSINDRSESETNSSDNINDTLINNNTTASEKQTTGKEQNSESTNKEDDNINKNCTYCSENNLCNNNQCEGNETVCADNNCLSQDSDNQTYCNNNCTTSNCTTEGRNNIFEKYLRDLSGYSNSIPECFNNGSCNIKIITGNNSNCSNSYCSLEEYLKSLTNNQSSNSQTDSNCNEKNCNGTDNTLNNNNSGNSANNYVNNNINTDTNSNLNNNENKSTGNNSNNNSSRNTGNSSSNNSNNASTSNDQISQYIDEVIRLVNVERNKAGLPSLTKNDKACTVANVRANEIVTSFSHTRPNGKDCFSVLSEYNISYRASGENIAMGQKTPAEVMEAWMNSSGHRANILSANFTEIGVGVVYSQGRYYWAQMFLG